MHFYPSSVMSIYYDVTLKSRGFLKLYHIFFEEARRLKILCEVWYNEYKRNFYTVVNLLQRMLQLEVQDWIGKFA